LVLNKTAPSTVRRGEIFNYNIRVTNTTGATLNNVVITDALPAGLIVVNAAPSTASTNPLTWNFPSILPFGVVDIVLTVQVPQNINQATISNSASGIASNFGGQATTNSNLNVVNVQAPRATSTPAVTAIPRAPTATNAPAPTAIPVNTVVAPTVEATVVVTETATPEVTQTIAPTATATVETATPEVTEAATVAPTPTVMEEIMPSPGTLPGLPDTGTNKPVNTGAEIAGLVLLLLVLGSIGSGYLFLRRSISRNRS
jgi:uncharacterized repeat protein (TIGR01451 family)